MNAGGKAGTFTGDNPDRNRDVAGLTSIGSSPLSASPGGASNTGLRAQLSRYEKERSACVNCASADTIEGKRNIQNIDSEINSLKARLTAVPRADATVSSVEARTATAPAAAGRIDVYA